jgi:Arc/MetJ family transcription regulator
LYAEITLSAYSGGVTRRTTLEVDDEVLAQVQAVLGTSGLKDTVDAAFARLLRTERLRRSTDQLVSGVLIELDPGLRAQMWR